MGSHGHGACKCAAALVPQNSFVSVIGVLSRRDGGCMRVLVFCTKYPYIPITVFAIAPLITLISAFCPPQQNHESSQIELVPAYLASLYDPSFWKPPCDGSLVSRGFSGTTPIFSSPLCLPPLSLSPAPLIGSKYINLSPAKPCGLQFYHPNLSKRCNQRREILLIQMTRCNSRVWKDTEMLL